MYLRFRHPLIEAELEKLKRRDIPTWNCSLGEEYNPHTTVEAFGAAIDFSDYWRDFWERVSCHGLLVVMGVRHGRKRRI